MSATLLVPIGASTAPRRSIDPNELPAFCPLPAAAGDERLSYLFRSPLKLGRIHPLYLPMLRYRHAKLTDRDRG